MTAALERELSTLAAAARRYDARHRRIARVAWPDGNRIAVNFTADFDAMLLRRLLNEPPMQLAKGEFGGRTGIWRLIALFDSHDIRATIFTPGRIRELYPQALHAAHASGHEIADHMWEHHVPRDMQLELDHLQIAAESNGSGAAHFDLCRGLLIDADGTAQKKFVGCAEPSLLRTLLRDGYLHSLGGLRQG